MVQNEFGQVFIRSIPNGERIAMTHEKYFQSPEGCQVSRLPFYTRAIKFPDEPLDML